MGVKMDGFEKLKDSLMASAQSEAEAILASATAESAVISKQAADEVWLLKERAAKELEELKLSEQRRAEAMRTLESRRRELTAKQALIDEVLDETLEKLRALPAERKQALYSRLLDEHAEEGQVLFCAPADEAMLRALLARKALSLKLAPKEKMTGGLIFSAQRYVEDRSFEALMESQRESLVALAARLLFGEDEPEGTRPAPAAEPVPVDYEGEAI